MMSKKDQYNKLDEKDPNKVIRNLATRQDTDWNGMIDDLFDLMIIDKHKEEDK